MELISILKREHKLLLEKMEAVNNLYSQALFSTQTALSLDLYAKCQDLKALLISHVELEDEKLYPALTDKLVGSQESLAQLHGLAATAAAFFRKYDSVADSPTARASFQREFQQLLEALKKRIRLEEETIYPLY